MPNNMDRTMMFKKEDVKKTMTEKELILYIKDALVEKGYNYINQIVGYLISGDPTYITSHKDARTLLNEYERDELLEEIVKFYLENADKYD